MADPAETENQNILPVQALFNVDKSFNTFIGQGQPFYATVNPSQSGLAITGSTINSTTIGATTPSTGVFTNILTNTGQVTTSPSGNTDIANKAYVDAVAQGLNPKAAVKCATTANITLSGLQTIDAYATLAGDRVLVKNQTSTPTNGIYIAAAGAWTRATDMDVWAEVPGSYCVVLNGGQAQTAWVSTSSETGTINVTPITFVQFAGNSTYYAGTGLSLAANTFSITNTGVTAANYGSASSVPVLAVNAQGQITSASSSSIAIAASQITSGTIASGLISGSYTGITGVGTLTAGTWNASTVGVAYGGTGAATFTAGYLKASGTSAFTTVSTIPNTDISGLGTMSTQNANAVAITGGTISGLSSPLGAASGGTGAATLTGYVKGNGTGAFTASATIPNTAISGLGTMSTQNANAVAITGGSINGVAIGTTTAGDGYFDVLHGNVYVLGTGSVTSLNIGTLTYTPANALISSQSSATTYNQIILQNSNTGTTASADFIVNNANSTDTTYYGDFGMNSSGFTGSGAFNQANNVYLTSTTADLAIGTTTANAIHFVINGGATDAMTISTSEVVSLKNALPIASGGTNGTATPTAGAIAYGSGTAYAFNSAGTSGQVLTSNGSSAPTWTTPTAYATVTDDTTTNSTRYPLFAAATSGNLTTEYTSSTKYQFNPSTGVLTATGFSGAGAFTTLSASSTVSGAGFSTYLASPPAIGGTAAAAGTFTTLTATADSAFTSTGSLQLPVGTTAQRPTGATGKLRFNSTTGQFEGYTGAAWASVSGAAITDDTTTNATRYPLFASTTSGTATTVYTSSTELKYNPSTGVLTATGGAVFGTNAVLGGLTNPIVAQASSANNYVQSYIYNANNGTSASSDIVAYANNSTDAHGWADIGFTSQSYADSVYTVTGPNEAYLFGSAPTGSGKTGNLVLATDNTGTENTIQFYVGGFTQAKSAWKAKIDANGISAPQVNATNGIHVNSQTVSANYTIATGDNGLSAGPVTVSSGITVTISSGSVWTVV